MNDFLDIFGKLKSHEVMPPEEAFEKIYDLLSQKDDTIGDSLSVLNQYEVVPPADILLLIEQDIFDVKDDSLASFASLKSYEVAPPVNQFEKIAEEAFVVNKKNSVSTPALVVNMLYKYRAVAAILLVALTTWAVYSVLNKSAGKDDGIVLQPGKKQPTVNTIDDTTTAVAVINDPVEKINNKGDKAVFYSAKVYKAENVFYSEYVSVDEYSMPVMHNDLMATFTSFSADKIPAFITDVKQESSTINLDGYTSISVSSAMKSIFKKMYKTKRNGKPTRKARKQKAKLERWKKADVIQFDNTLGHNPLDPLDLADFIFK